MDNIQWLHAEVTTRCNAWCPFCPRNLDGYTILPGLDMEDLPVESLEQRIKQFPNLDGIQFCGIFGDPCAAKNIDELLDCAFSFDNIKTVQIQKCVGYILPETIFVLKNGKKVKNNGYDCFYSL